jgi:hypothetical protein
MLDTLRFFTLEIHLTELTSRTTIRKLSYISIETVVRIWPTRVWLDAVAYFCGRVPVPVRSDALCWQ